MFWHLATAKWTVEHGALLRQDVFSSTVPGQPYAVGEWLGELILYAAYVVGGWVGIAILRGLLVATFAFFVARLVRWSGAPPLVTVPLIVAAIAVSSITWTDRPQLWTLAFVPALLGFFAFPSLLPAVEPTIYIAPAHWHASLSGNEIGRAHD